MKPAGTVSRYLLGLIFVIFGFNGLMPFLPQPPIDGLAGQFFGAVVASHYITVVFVVQLVCGILLLANRYVPLAVTVLGAVIFNIILFHLTMNLGGLPPAVFALILWIIVALNIRSAFAGIFQQRTPEN